jgi:hypothetical protein
MTAKLLSFLAIAALLVAAVWLLLITDEAAYMAWANGGSQPPSQLPRDLLAAACVLAAGLVAWFGRRRP